MVLPSMKKEQAEGFYRRIGSFDHHTEALLQKGKTDDSTMKAGDLQHREEGFLKRVHGVQVQVHMHKYTITSPLISSNRPLPRPVGSINTWSGLGGFDRMGGTVNLSDRFPSFPWDLTFLIPCCSYYSLSF